MNKEYFLMLYDYNYWVNKKILDAAEKVSDAQFVANAPHSFGSLRGTLVHTLTAEWIWLSRWQGVSPTAILNETEFPNLASLRSRWREEEQKMRAFLATLNDEDLLRVVQYTSTRGDKFARVLWIMLAHVVNHGTKHRAEAAAIMAELDASPGDVDLVRYADARNPATRLG